MKTDRLIEMLSANLEPVQAGRFRRLLALALVVGGIAALCMMATARLASALENAVDLGYLALKLSFACSLIAIGSVFLLRSALPGRDGRKPYVLSFAPLLAIAAAGVAVLAFGRPAPWVEMLFGTQWATCLLCIPLYAVVPFAALIWALRQGAPTDPRSTGAIAGLVAGAIGAAAYAFQCPDDSIPFIAVWYGGVIALCALVGSLLGPHLLRW